MGLEAEAEAEAAGEYIADASGFDTKSSPFGSPWMSCACAGDVDVVIVSDVGVVAHSCWSVLTIAGMESRKWANGSLYGAWIHGTSRHTRCGWM